MIPELVRMPLFSQNGAMAGAIGLCCGRAVLARRPLAARDIKLSAARRIELSS